MHPLLKPMPALAPRITRDATLLLLLASALLVVVAAGQMPAPYAWQSHSISESAAQGQAQAWVARLSFLCFGAGVLLLTCARRASWARLAFLGHAVFAISMFATAAFSHQPFAAGEPFDAFEDRLHSIFASGMGFAFVAGVLARTLQRESPSRRTRLLDAGAILAATLLPPLGLALPEVAGALQRAMFAVAYSWYAAEAIESGRERSSDA